MSKHWLLRLTVIIAGILAVPFLFALGVDTSEVQANDPSSCITCHTTETPGVVTQWEECAMSATLDCSSCHGSAHMTDTDVDNVKMPTPDTCAPCHSRQVTEYREGKHALAWAAMNAMPMAGHQPQAITGAEGYKGCSYCHKIGEKSEADYAADDFDYGTASCDSCHTRHSFSVEEAQDPRACQTCHMGFDHPQWEMWSTSKHGSIWQAEDGSERAPTCQDCHLVNGTHNNITAWGFLALRVPEEDQDWWADRVVILKAIGVLDAEGNGTERLDVVVAAKVARTTKEEFDALRAKQMAVCQQCHSESFVAGQFTASDGMVREADKLMAEAITIVNQLYEDGYLEKPEGWTYAPDLLQFYDSNSSVEHELFTMFLEYRQRTFQGAFHANPDYTYWYGYASMQNSLQFIKDEAASIRAEDNPASNTGIVVAIVALAVGVVALGVGAYALSRRKAAG